mgnify:CR=1 FL=1
MGMSKNISNFLNSINDKRIANALQKVMNQTQPIGLDTAITAFATGGQTNARVLRQDCAYHDVTTVATAADSVALPAAVVGEVHFVKNSAALSMQVYAPTPDTIDSVATGTGVAQLAGDGVLYVCVVRGNYVRLGGVSATEIFGDITVTGLTTTGPIVYDHNTTITAFAGGGQGSATALTGEFNNVTTCATAGDSVKLLTAALGQNQTVKNSGATALAVFPFSGDSINALAVNLSVDIPPGGQMTFRAISATVWESDEMLVSQAPSTQKGSLVVKAADSAGNTVTTITNASQAAARIYTVPDAGGDASMVMTEGAQTINGVKTFGSIKNLKASNAITAFATGGQASGTLLTSQVNSITVCATGGDSVRLPTSVAGMVLQVSNLGAAFAAVFPISGDLIDALGANVAVKLAVGESILFTCAVAGSWKSTPQRAIGTFTTGTTQTTFAAGQLTGGALVTYESTVGTPGSIATRTATQMFDEDPYSRVGGTYRLRVHNNQGTGTLTITAGSGVTLTGTATIVANAWRDYIVTYTSATALVMQNIGAGTT